MYSEGNAKMFVDSYLDATAEIENTCQAVSNARYKALNSQWFKSNNFFNTKHIESVLVSLDPPVGSFVALIEPWKEALDLSYLPDREYVYVQMTNGEEFSRHHFPRNYLLWPTDEIIESEIKLYQIYADYRDSVIAKKEKERALACAQYEKESADKAAQKERTEYLRLKAKYEGVTIGN
jgi:hypothetical protein